MKLAPTAFALVVGLTNALPALPATNCFATANPDFPAASSVLTVEKRSSARFSCGQYKFADGTVQELYSQVWAGYPADEMICRYFKYEFGGKKGQEGSVVAAKVDFGCTCFFYETPCDPGVGLAERWEGWMGWQNYVSTDKSFGGWYCFEQS